jgi:hypothetical protein
LPPLACWRILPGLYMMHGLYAEAGAALSNTGIAPWGTTALVAHWLSAPPIARRARAAPTALDRPVA